MSIGAGLRHLPVENACPGTGCDRAKRGVASPIAQLEDLCFPYNILKLLNKYFFLTMPYPVA
jgi:hypothetical protein